MLTLARIMWWRKLPNMHATIFEKQMLKKVSVFPCNLHLSWAKSFLSRALSKLNVSVVQLGHFASPENASKTQLLYILEWNNWIELTRLHADHGFWFSRSTDNQTWLYKFPHSRRMKTIVIICVSGKFEGPPSKNVPNPLRSYKHVMYVFFSKDMTQQNVFPSSVSQFYCSQHRQESTVDLSKNITESCFWRASCSSLSGHLLLALAIRMCYLCKAFKSF